MTPSAPPASVVFLRGELVRAAARRRARGRSLALSVTALLLLVATVALARPVPALADVDVEVRAGRLFVRLVDLEHRPDHIEGVLRGVGLDASVVAAPVGPSRVGRFVGALDDAALAAEVHRLGADRDSFGGLSVPLRWPGHLDLRVGRPAEAGEPYAVFSDALAPGEPLACRPLLGRPVAEVLPALASLDLEVVVDRGTGDDDAVVAIEAASARRIVVRLGPPSPATTATSPECPT
jgi:hypothetical protein